MPRRPARLGGTYGKRATRTALVGLMSTGLAGWKRRY